MAQNSRFINGKNNFEYLGKTITFIDNIMNLRRQKNGSTKKPNQTKKKSNFTIITSKNNKKIGNNIAKQYS